MLKITEKQRTKQQQQQENIQLNDINNRRARRIEDGPNHLQTRIGEYVWWLDGSAAFSKSFKRKMKKENEKFNE